MSSRTLIDRAAVAARLGHSVEWLYKNMKRLTKKGFPAPVDGNMVGARWDPLAIDRWLDARLPETMLNTGPSFTVSPDLAADTAELDRRSAALAAGRGRRG